MIQMFQVGLTYIFQIYIHKMLAWFLFLVHLFMRLDAQNSWTTVWPELRNVLYPLLPESNISLQICTQTTP